MMLQELQARIETTPGLLGRLSKQEKAQILSLVDDTPSHYRLSERVWLTLHHLKARPICKMCSNEVTSFQGVLKGYGRYCSSGCMGSDPDHVNARIKKTNYADRSVKIKQTVLDRYGVDSPLKNSKILEKAIAARKAKHQGQYFSEETRRQLSDNCFFNDRDAVKDRMLLKHGVDHPMKLDSARESVIRTWNKKTEAELELIAAKKRKTTLLRYGSDHVFQVESIKNAIKSTLFARHGVEYVMQSPDLLEKAKATYLTRYGVDNPSKNSDVAKLISITNRENKSSKLESTLSGLSKLGYTFSPSVVTDYVNDAPTVITHSCGSSYLARIKSNYVPRCPQPACEVNSGLELIISDLIASVYTGAVVLHDRTILGGKEIDFYLPDVKLGIEVHGSYWHQASKIGPKLHAQKANLAEKAGIKLLQLFDHEILSAPEIIKSMINHRLGRSNKLYARKAQLVALSRSTEIDFFTEHHLSGYARSQHAYALSINDEVISAISVAVPRFSRIKTGLEIVRYATRRGYSVSGGFQKLLQHVIRTHQPTEIITFADRRFSTGEVYKSAGFDHLYDTRPNYWYFRKDVGLINRTQCQKSKLSKLLGDTFNPALTEVENMQSNGFWQVFDAGHGKFRLSINTEM